MEQVPDPVPDELVHRLHLELAGERRADLVDDRQLARPAPRLVDEAGVLEGDAQAGRDGRQEADVRVAERVLPVEVLERDDARGLAGDDERHEQDGLRRLPGHDARLAVLRHRVGGERADQQRLAGRHHVTPDAGGRPGMVDRERFVGEADAALDRVREPEQARLAIHDRDVHHLGVEDLLDLVADEVVHPLHVELRREARLDAVDDRQLGVALAGLLDGADAAQGGRDVLADEREQVHVGLRVAVDRVVALDDEDPDGPSLCVQGHAQPVLARRTEGVDLALGR